MFRLFLRKRERDRETENELRRSRKRQGYPEPEAGSRLWAVSTEPDMGLEPTNDEIMTWAKVGQLTDWATQVPLDFIKNFKFFYNIYILSPNNTNLQHLFIFGSYCIGMKFHNPAQIYGKSWYSQFFISFKEFFPRGALGWLSQLRA